MTIGDYTFGKPAKITVNTYTGKSGIVNIEREVEISGPSLKWWYYFNWLFM